MEKLQNEIKSLAKNHPKGIQEWIEMDVIPLIEETIKENLEDTKGDSPSINENLEVEDMYDFIVGNLFKFGVDETKELQDAIRKFGKMRYNQAIKDMVGK